MHLLQYTLHFCAYIKLIKACYGQAEVGLGCQRFSLLAGPCHTFVRTVCDTVLLGRLLQQRLIGHANALSCKPCIDSESVPSCRHLYLQKQKGSVRRTVTQMSQRQ